MSGFNLEVRLYNQVVGRLIRNHSGLVSFTPNGTWLSKKQQPRLGWSFLMKSYQQSGTGVPIWFENLLPEENSMIRQRICKQHGLRFHDSAALLAILGEDLPGAVQVFGGRPLSENTSTLAFEQGELRFSLTGMQIKLSMLLSGKRFVLPARGEFGQWIVKIPHEQTPELVPVEIATMKWGAATGLSVPACHAVPIKRLEGVDRELIGTPHEAFAIRRFDRLESGARVHQEDFAQVFQIYPMHKYSDGGSRRVTYAGMAYLIGDAAGRSQQGLFLEQLAFVIASGNGDAHLKNWSFQWLEGSARPQMSPIYDQVATISWSQFGWGKKRSPRLALKFGKTREFDRINRECVRVFAENARIPDGEARILAGLERARAAWMTIRMDAPERMQAAVDEHWRRVPLLQSL